MTSPSSQPDLKFIHLADTHLGLNWPPIGRLEHIQIPIYAKAFATIIDAAVAQHVDFVIHGGDLVDRPRPSNAAWNRLLQELPRLKEVGIPFIVTPGSHDRPESYFDKAGGDVLEILDRRLGFVKRVDTDRDAVFKFESRSGKEIVVYGLGDHGSEQEEHLQTLREKMDQDSDFKILLMHGPVSSMPNLGGRTARTETINDVLSSGVIDYVALGHYHKRWEDRKMQVYNPGSTEFTSFADAPTVSYTFEGGALKEESKETVQHGYYLVEVSGEIINAQFIPLETRDVKSIQIRFNGATAAQVTTAAQQAISANMSVHSIIRPVFRGTLHPSSSRTEIDLREILAAKQKVLYLDYPLMDFEQESISLQATQDSDIGTILEQYFVAKVGDNAHETGDIAVRILKVYERKVKTAHQEALKIIDGWKPK